MVLLPSCHSSLFLFLFFLIVYLVCLAIEIQIHIHIQRNLPRTLLEWWVLKLAQITTCKKVELFKYKVNYYTRMQILHPILFVYDWDKKENICSGISYGLLTVDWQSQFEITWVIPEEKHLVCCNPPESVPSVYLNPPSAHVNLPDCLHLHRHAGAWGKQKTNKDAWHLRAF